MKKQVFIYVPEKETFLAISAGEYLNLSEKDLDEGYVDYVYIDFYAIVDSIDSPPYIKLKYGTDIKTLKCVNGGTYMIKKEFTEYYHKEEEYIKDALDLIFDNKDLFYIELDDIFK